MIVSAEQILADIAQRRQQTRQPRRASDKTEIERVAHPRGKRVKHGTPTTYGYGCRCDTCKAAHAAAQRARVARRRLDRLRGVPLPDRVKHGTENAYTNWACRCMECSFTHDERKHEEYIRRTNGRVRARRHI